jgi:hypothetical protein
MNMNEDKMHDEMIENGKGSGGIEAGLGEEDGKMMRRAVLKMDCRYVFHSRCCSVECFCG